MTTKIQTLPVAVVTGGSRGIGRQITKLLTQKGYKVYFTFRSDKESAKTLTEELNTGEYSGEAIGCQCDMVDMNSVTELFNLIKKQAGRVDVLVNNAGVLGEMRPFLFANDGRWYETLDHNVKCVTNSCKRVLPLMIRQKKGRIVNVTSIAARLGNPGQSAYAASKAAIVAFSKSLYREVSPMGITINCVSPGLVDTDMTNNLNEKYTAEILNTPLARMAYASEVANMVSYLATDAPEYLLGQELILDGGLGL
ncbi:MAG: SDR family NAD(P)-dependent oxidoreductase [Saprospiraceae bacterium]